VGRFTGFYIDQSVGAVFDELVIPPGPDGFDDSRARDIILTLQNFRPLVEAAMVGVTRCDEQERA
jgi:hypothetical protein